jgi:cellulose synthase/poly-beta-1,6-N-acetylglucosamine synthase-like glycosyltransferase
MSEPRLDVDFIIPAYNEGIGIQHTLESMLAQTFDQALRLHVKVVANNCSDNTVQIAESEIPTFEEHPNLSLAVFNTDIRGKQKALNYGLERSSSPITLIGDADIRYGKGCLEAVVRALDDPDVYISAPFSAPVLPERPTTLLEQVQMIKKIRREENTPTAPNGTLIGFKREAIDTFPTNIASEDTWLSLVTARDHGWAAIHIDRDVQAYFKSPTNWPEFLRQEARFLRGTRQLLEVKPELKPVLEAGEARQLETQELDQRVAKRWIDAGYSLSTLVYFNTVLPTQIEETYEELKNVLVRPDLTWDQAITTKQF